MEKVDRGRADALARFGKRGKLDKWSVEIIAKVDVEEGRRRGELENFKKWYKGSAAADALGRFGKRGKVDESQVKIKFESNQNRILFM